MKHKRVEIINPGPALTLVSNQVNNQMFYGYTHGGAMDVRTSEFVNQILRNPTSSKLLECTMKACKLFFHQATEICIGGADMDWKLDDASVPYFEKIIVDSGQILSGGYAKKGFRSYIGFSDTLDKIEDDLLILEQRESLEQVKDSVVLDVQASFKINHQLTIKRGPEWQLLNQESKEQLIDFEATISNKMSRMGVYLESNSITLKNEFPKQSVCTFPGVIQLLPSGQLLVLAQDAQTTGGYPRIAYLDGNNLCDFNQLGIGQKIKWRLLL